MQTRVRKTEINSSTSEKNINLHRNFTNVQSYNGRNTTQCKKQRREGHAK